MSKESIVDELTEQVVDETTNIVPTPIEEINPLGYGVGPLSVIVLILQGVVGTGIFATPGSVLKSMGSVGSTYVLWITGFLIPLLSSYLYIEFAGYFPKRNGGDVAYLEEAYPRPKFLVPTVYAAISVSLSFTTSSALAFGQYVLNASEVETKTWYYRGIAIGALTLACFLVAVSTNLSLRLQNILGFIKVIFMMFIVILGWVILGGGTKVADPTASFKNMWEGTTTDGYNITNSIIKVVFSYGGYNYAFAVVAEFVGSKGEEKSNERKLRKTFAIYVPASLFVIFVFYILMITSYYASAPPSDIKASGMSVASLLFERAFDNKYATKFLDVMVALSAFGHLITAILSHSRSLRESGRQGVLPYPKFWTCTKPFGTPLGPILITWIVNIIMIVGPPAGAAYDFIVDMGSYSSYIFTLCAICGLLKVRRDRRKRGLDNKGEYLPLPIVIILLLFEILVMVMAFVPPGEGANTEGDDGGIFYATYPIVTLGLLAGCVIYYAVWRYVLPRMGKYVHREVIYQLENGEMGNTVVKVRLEDVVAWDAEHKDTVLAEGGERNERETEGGSLEFESVNSGSSK